MRNLRIGSVVAVALFLTSPASAQELSASLQAFGGIGVGSFTTTNTNFGGVISGSLTDNIQLLGEGGRIFIMRLYLVRERRMHEVSLQEFRAGELRRRIDAAEATWDGSRWVFASGFLRTFEDGREVATPFARMAVDGIAERPEDFAKELRSPDQMNFLELRRYIDRLRASGARVANYLVDLHLKLAFPLVNVIVVMIGAAVATRLRLQSAAIGFGLSIAIAFVYYGFMRTGQALGHNGALPPYVAAWMGDVAFGAVGIVMMVQAQRR